MKRLLIKILSIVLILVMVANLVLLVSGIFNSLWFWVIIAICAVIAFFVMPKLKGKKT